MKRSSFSFVVVVFLVELWCSAAVPTVEETCKELVVEQQYYQFCVTALKSNPKSQGADMDTLMRIAVDMSLASLHSTAARIEQLAGQSGAKELQRAAYSMCRSSYAGGLNKMEQALPYFEKGGYIAASNFLYATLDRVQSCIDSFTKTGTVPALLDENNEAVKLIRLVAKLMERCSQSAAAAAAAN